MSPALLEKRWHHECYTQSTMAPKLPPGLRYTNDRAMIIRIAREKGLSDKEILKQLVAGEVASERRRIIREWANDLGLTEDEALRVAREAGLIAR